MTLVVVIACLLLGGLGLIELVRHSHRRYVRFLQSVMEIPREPDIKPSGIPNPKGWLDNPPNLQGKRDG